MIPQADWHHRDYQAMRAPEFPAGRNTYAAPYMKFCCRPRSGHRWPKAGRALIPQLFLARSSGCRADLYHGRPAVHRLASGSLKSERQVWLWVRARLSIGSLAQLHSLHKTPLYQQPNQDQVSVCHLSRYPAQMQYLHSIREHIAPVPYSGKKGND